MIKRIAYWIVLKDLTKNNMFNGSYDARNGNASFMYGMALVMEQIAYNVSTKTGDEFALNFADNMIFSEVKAKRKEVDNEQYFKNRKSKECHKK